MKVKDREDAAVVVKRVYKSFRLPHERHNGIKQLVLNFYRRRRYEKQNVLKGVDFEIKRGEFFGIVGRNGSGKSTLLKLLAGIYVPEKGSIEVRGGLTPFIELGVGFNPELTGRENVFLNGALLGFSRKEMEAMYDDIVEFAELEAFMDQRLKNYSSGMQVRLAFSIAIRADNDILLLDEVLAVGDAIFQKKCYSYFKELKRNKKTVIFVSHDTSILQEYCDRGVLIEAGKVVSKGKIGPVVKDYIDLLNEREEDQASKAKDSHGKKLPQKTRWGTGDIKSKAVITLDPVTGKERSVFSEAHESIRFQVTYAAQKAQDKPIYGVTITDAEGRRVFESNTLWSKVNTGRLLPGKPVTITWDVPNVFNTGTFHVSPAAADPTATIIYDWWDEAASFKVRKTQYSSALINVTHDVTVK